MKLTKSASPSSSSKKSYVRLGWMVALALIAGITIGAVGTWLLAERVDQLKTDLTKAPAQEPFVVSQVNIETPTSTTPVDEVEAPADLLVLNIDWRPRKELSRSAIRSLFASATTNTQMMDRLMKKTSKELTNVDEPDPYVCDEVIGRVWSIGQVKDGEYAGESAYYVELIGACGMSDYSVYYEVIERKMDTGSELMFVTDRPNDYMNMTEDRGPFFSVVHPFGATIAGLNLSKTVEMENGKKVHELHIEESDLVSASERAAMDVVGKTKTGDPFYVRTKIYESFGFVGGRTSNIGLVDDMGRFHEYGSFLGERADGDGGFYASVEGTSIQWNSERDQTDLYYPFLMGGCGPGAINVVDVNEASLQQAGVSVEDGDPIFVPKDFVSAQATKIAFDQWLVFKGTKGSVEDFLEKYPIPYFLWKDVFGQWVQYTSERVQPVGECGKPVIYLYPEKKTDIRVSLPKFINVTVSDPTYPSKGWVVTANPNGDLVSHADGKTYGSLFWEGTGVGYQTPTTGFVVKREDVGLFFASTLPKYGLNQKESQEFMDFWVPRMASSSYYQVSFLTDAWSKAAPLNVFPRPKTSIRIFMDLKPLSAPISIKAPTIVTPKRDGFTLVEWGGLLY